MFVNPALIIAPLPFDGSCHNLRCVANAITPFDNPVGFSEGSNKVSDVM